MTRTGASWTAQSIPPAVNCNLIPGVLLKGVNIAPKPTHSASGHVFRSLFAEWDWSGWIKPQIDAAKGVGANAIRLIGDLEGVNDGTFTQVYYDNKWAQLITYCDSLAMHVYPAGGGVGQVPTTGDRAGFVATTVAAAADKWDDYDNVVGIDVLQESMRIVPSNSIVQPDPALVLAPVRAVTTKPLTCSNSADLTYGVGRLANPRWRSQMRDHIDFWDIHVYFNPTPTMLYDSFWGQGEGKAILIGEYGLGASAGQTAQTARYESVRRAANRQLYGLHAAGAFAWAGFDQGVGDEAFGMFETNGTPRTALTESFQRLPTA